VPPKQTEHESADTITVNGVIKWSGIFFTSVSALVSLIWFAALLKGDIITLQQENISTKRENDLRFDQQIKDIDKLKDHADVTDKTLDDMGRKLDVAVALLERIDQKVGKP
jgi:hypothetical protein